MRGLFSERLFNKFRGIWPFLDMVMRGLFFSKKKILKKSGFLAQKHGDNEGTFFRPSFYQIPGHLAVFKSGNEGTFF